MDNASPYGHPQPGKIIADAAALAAIAATDRHGGMVRQLVDGTIWRFVATSTDIAETGKVIAPAAGTGRWLRLSDAKDIQFFELACDHAQATATAAVKFFKAPRAFIIDGVDYINPTGLAQHADNHFTIAVNNDALVAAAKNTKTGEGGSLAANTFTALVNGTLANRTVPAGGIVSLVLTMAGTATLPVGKVVVHGRYI